MLSKLLPNVYEGWIVVFSTSVILLLLSTSVFYGFGPMFNPIRDEFGWSAGQLGLAFSVRSEVNGVAAPFVGALLDRVSSQRIMIMGLAVVVASMFLLSFMQNLLHFYLLMLMMAVGTSTTGGQVTMVSTVTWFERKRANALALATAGGAAGGLLTAGVALLVEQLGWRDAMRVMATVLAIGGGLVALNVRTRPRNHHQPMDGVAVVRPPNADGSMATEERWGVPLREAIRTRAFLLLGLAQAAIFFVWTSVIVHQIPFLEDEGISKGQAGIATAALSVSALATRVVVGRLADDFGRREVLLASVIFTTVSVALLLVVHDIWVAIFVSALIGLGAGAANPLRTALLADYFGIRHFGAINGLGMFIGTLGAFVGPYAVGVLFDRTDSYDAGWIVTALVSASAIPLLLFARPPRELTALYDDSAPASGATTRAESAP